MRMILGRRLPVPGQGFEEVADFKNADPPVGPLGPDTVGTGMEAHEVLGEGQVVGFQIRANGLVVLLRQPDAEPGSEIMVPGDGIVKTVTVRPIPESWVCRLAPSMPLTGPDH